MHVLVTGGAGFIGSHIVDRLMADPSNRVTVVDRLSKGGSLMNLESHSTDERFRMIVGDVSDLDLTRGCVEAADRVIHAAAESHVDRSIDDPRPFMESNVIGTQSVLDAVRRTGKRMLMVSTDEVYGEGDASGGVLDEDHPLRPRSPYAASKAAADMLCQAYVTTYGTDVTIIRGTNAYGPRQIERVVPTYSLSAIEGKPLPVYGQGLQRREFLYVEDWVDAALTVLEKGRSGTVYNVGRGFELPNVDLARRICALAGVDESLISFVADRPGHDFRYGVSSQRLESLGWAPKVGFDDGLARTFDWYRSNVEWLAKAHPDGATNGPRALAQGDAR